MNQVPDRQSDPPEVPIICATCHEEIVDNSQVHCHNCDCSLHDNDDCRTKCGACGRPLCEDCRVASMTIDEYFCDKDCEGEYIANELREFKALAYRLKEKKKGMENHG